MAKKTASLLLENGMGITSFPNLRMKGVDHVQTVRNLARAKIDLVFTFSGDGTILRLLRSLDTTIPCLCVNVGGRGILAEIKPAEALGMIGDVISGNFLTERRLRISAKIGGKVLPPALNEIVLVRRTFAKTPRFQICLEKGVGYSQRMDGLILSTPTGSTGHSFSYGSPFIQGTLGVFALTPLAPIYRFPTMVISPSNVRIRSDFALQLVVDGQETFSVEKETEVTISRHRNDAVFVRLNPGGSFRQLSNFISLEAVSNMQGRKT